MQEVGYAGGQVYLELFEITKGVGKGNMTCNASVEKGFFRGPKNKNTCCHHLTRRRW
jgi:hypothetical protein